MHPFDVIQALQATAPSSHGVFLLNKLTLSSAQAFILGQESKPRVPLETWGEIFKYIMPAESKRQHVPVIQIKSDFSDSLLFRRISLPQDEFEDQEAVEKYEDFLRDVGSDDSEHIKLKKKKEKHRISLSLAHAANQVIALVRSETTHLIQLAILCTDVDVPDVISYIFDGKCNFCRGGRDICPGCTGGRSEKFGVAMGCGVDLACPLCLGSEFSYQDKQVLLEYYWERMPKSVEMERREKWNRRFKELNYPAVSWEEDEDKGEADV
jgi:hypothetical protein